MRNYNENSYCTTPTYDVCEVINGNNIDFEIKKNDCEIRADIVVSRIKTVRIWGQIKDCDGAPVSNALVKLVKPVDKCGHVEYVGIAHTVTDCKGFYQFDVASCQGNSSFKILVGKSTNATDRVISNQENCHYKPQECNVIPEPCCPKPEPCYSCNKVPEKQPPCKSTGGKCREIRCDKPCAYYYSE